MSVRFARHLADHGARVALLFADGSHLTYAELAGLVADRAAGFGTDRRLILWEARPDRAALITYLAALQAGHPILPVAPLDAHPQAARHCAALIATYQPDLIATDPSPLQGGGREGGRSSPAFPHSSPMPPPDLPLKGEGLDRGDTDHLGLVAIGEDPEPHMLTPSPLAGGGWGEGADGTDALQDPPHRSLRSPPLPRGERLNSNAYHPDLSLLLSTSGSTGAAKLVRLSAANLDANAASIASYLALTADDRAALILPLHYAYGLSVLHAHLSVGASIHLGSPHILAPDFMARIKAARCTNMSGVPYSFDLLEQIGFREADLPDLRFMSVAGGRLAPELVRRYAGYLRRRDADFFVMYGQTEATSRIAYLPPSAALGHADCIGDAIPGGSLSLIDGNGDAITQAQVSGELVYRGPNVMMGYAETRADLRRGAELAELRTGDLAERMPAGFYRITGRSSRFSKIAGLRIGHDAIERVFEARGIDLAVTGDDRIVYAAFTGHHDAAALRMEIAQSAGLNLSFIRVAAMAALPRRANGKIDYADLKAGFEDAAPLALPDSVQQAFAETFAPRRVGATDSFVSLGGDSLSFVQLSLALEQILGILPRDWEQRSVADLAHHAAPVAAPAQHASLWKKWRDSWRPLDANHFMRAFAILLIVLHHATLWEISGGAATLLVLAGYNIARFQAAKLLAGRVASFLRAILRPLVLYYAVLLVYCAYTDRFPWQSLLLLGNLGLDGYSTMPTPLVAYWFIEAYAQMMLLVAGLFAWPAVRSAVSARPFISGLVFLGLAVVAREAQPHVWNAGEMAPFTMPRVLYLAAIGWCIYFADTAAKRIFMTALMVSLFILLPYAESATAPILWVRAGVLVISSVTLLWWANIALPRRLAGWLSAIAAASYSIYLFHNVPFFLWLEDAKLPRLYDNVLHMVLGLGLGLAAHHLLQILSLRARRSSLAQILWREPARLQPGE